MIAAAALAVLGAGRMVAQEPSAQDKKALEERINELQDEVRELRRQLRDQDRDVGPRLWLRGPEPGGDGPGMVRRMEIRGGRRPRLGVLLKSEESRGTDSLGVVIDGVTPSGPADKAGLKAGDIITNVNGESLAMRSSRWRERTSPSRRLIEWTRDLKDGDTVKVEYRRGEEKRTATVIAKDLPADGFAYGFSTDSLPFKFEMDPMALGDMFTRMRGGWLDMELVALTPELGEYFGTTQGVLVVRAPRDGAINLKSGDVILKIGDRSAGSPQQALRILHSYEGGETVQFEVMRQKKRITVSGKVPEARERDRFFGRDRDRHQEEQ